MTATFSNDNRRPPPAALPGAGTWRSALAPARFVLLHYPPSSPPARSWLVAFGAVCILLGVMAALGCVAARHDWRLTLDRLCWGPV